MGIFRRSFKRSSILISFISLHLQLVTFAFGAGPIEVILSPKPQAKHDTCQSYALAYALASIPGSSYNVTTASQLRKLELDIRGAIDREAQAHVSKDPLNHDVWKQAIKGYTLNRYKLSRDTYADIVALMQKVAELTGVTNADTLGTVIAAALIKRPVLTSVTMIDDDPYAGHIISVLGMSGGTSSSTKLLALNPAVKTPDSYKNACRIDDLPGDYKYSAAATLTSNFSLKQFSGRFVLMWIEKLN